MDDIKKYILTAVASFLLATLVVIGGMQGYVQSKINAPQLLKGIGYQNAVSYTKFAPATTTRSYLTPGTGTTTLTVHAGEFGKMALGLQFTASTSNAVVNVNFEASDNQIDWYQLSSLPSSISLNQGVFEIASSTQGYRWQPGSLTASTSYLSIAIPDYPSDYLRVIATLPATSSVLSAQMNGAVWMEFAHRED